MYILSLLGGVCYFYCFKLALHLAFLYHINLHDLYQNISYSSIITEAWPSDQFTFDE